MKTKTSKTKTRTLAGQTASLRSGRLFGPSRTTIRKRLKELRALIDNEATDKVTSRVAYEAEQAIRWATEKTVGWPSPAQSARDTAERIKAGH